MRLIIAVPLIAALSLAACKKEAVVAKDESVEAVAKKVAASEIKPLPGRWESTVRMERMDAEGLPPQVKDAMTRQMSKANTFSSCLTAEQVNKPDGGFFAGGAKGCTYKKFVMADGRIEAEMACGPEMGGQTMTMAGTYADSRYDITVNSVTPGPAGKPMTMVLNVASQRTGACDGKEDVTAEDVKKMEDYAKSMEAKNK